MTDVRALLSRRCGQHQAGRTAFAMTAMADRWAAHDRVARDLLHLHSGREIDKTDGMLMMFERAPTPLHRDGLPPRSRRAGGTAGGGAGLHVGPVSCATTARKMSNSGPSSGGRRSCQAHRRARHGAGARGSDAADPGKPAKRSVRQTSRWSHMATGSSRRGPEPIELFEVAPQDGGLSRLPIPRRPTASSSPATGGCRSRTFPIICRFRPHRSSAATSSSRRPSPSFDSGTAADAARNGGPRQDATRPAGRANRCIAP